MPSSLLLEYLFFLWLKKVYGISQYTNLLYYWGCMDRSVSARVIIPVNRSKRSIFKQPYQSTPWQIAQSSSPRISAPNLANI